MTAAAAAPPRLSRVGGCGALDDEAEEKLSADCAEAVDGAELPRYS